MKYNFYLEDLREFSKILLNLTTKYDKEINLKNVEVETPFIESIPQIIKYMGDKILYIQYLLSVHH